MANPLEYKIYKDRIDLGENGFFQKYRRRMENGVSSKTHMPDGVSIWGVTNLVITENKQNLFIREDFPENPLECDFPILYEEDRKSWGIYAYDGRGYRRNFLITKIEEAIYAYFWQLFHSVGYRGAPDDNGPPDVRSADCDELSLLHKEGKF